MKVPTMLGLAVLIYFMLGLFTDIFAQSTTTIVVNEYTWSNEKSTYRIIVIDDDNYNEYGYYGYERREFYTPYYYEPRLYGAPYDSQVPREKVNYSRRYYRDKRTGNEQKPGSTTFRRRYKRK